MFAYVYQVSHIIIIIYVCHVQVRQDSWGMIIHPIIGIKKMHV